MRKKRTTRFLLDTVRVVDTGEPLIAGVVDTGDKYSLANISANFQKNSKWDTQGLGGNCSMKKIAAENLVSDSL